MYCNVKDHRPNKVKAKYYVQTKAKPIFPFLHILMFGAIASDPGENLKDQNGEDIYILLTFVNDKYYVHTKAELIFPFLHILVFVLY